jgi:membrane protease YdiL (CAAX protease family)
MALRRAKPACRSRSSLDCARKHAASRAPLVMRHEASRTRRRFRDWMSGVQALLAVPWMFIWLIPVVALFELTAGWATIVLALAVTAFLWRNVLRPLRSRPRVVASYRLRPWRQYAGWLTVAVVAEVTLILATLIVHEQLAEWRFLPRISSSSDFIPPHVFSHLLGPIAIGLAAVVLSPMVEEFAFRGRMQSRLERAVGVVPAIVIPAVFFSFLHGVTTAPHHLPFALLLGWVVWRTGSIWTAVYMHAVNNAVAVAAAYLEHEWEVLSNVPPVPLWPYAIPVGVVAVCVLLLAGTRIDRIAQVSRPHTQGFSRRRSSARDFTVVLRG